MQVRVGQVVRMRRRDRQSRRQGQQGGKGGRGEYRGTTGFQGQTEGRLLAVEVCMSHVLYERLKDRSKA